MDLMGLEPITSSMPWRRADPIAPQARLFVDLGGVEPPSSQCECDALAN